ncbi:Pyruvate/2-oxoglutarate/acetoin dehydrogenase complex, dehydrogenase (E1) component [Parapedobacter composti]|uniref:3-methyl-2-oxobutanoate dehydrogenase (2-methylpropanoyl-transferring) n=1 Tax=Parapedobacter composti TaxID=623281 RepID=A0A1I1H8B5_9SPHI|nr:alpha-ketoacid dehydrogenase subunit alpha/beta [Parapedobacter composti]SFC20399.1 Pyruvate/2-oxoglutarate/acetoin dehydrogenase complex, dehydrogenase (E1) component [Parapedobacter composti]
MSDTHIKQSEHPTQSKLSFDDFKALVVQDYRMAVESRFVSLLGRKEVLTGKAKFGVFGDGKELAQIAMAKVFQLGDWRSGYYRDQTFMFAAGIVSVYQFFSQLYAHPDLEADPSSAGRQMNSHFATRMLTPEGRWVDQTLMKNSASDISTTGGQMPRLLGFGLASKLYRNNPELAAMTAFSNNGNEVAFGTVGNASTSEGVFFEAVNAAGVRQIPVVISIWDDGYGISVPNEVQTTKADISEVLKGFQRDEKGEGFEIFKVKGWDYPGLCETYERAAHISREHHIPVLIHVTEMTQPQGHSSSGSHERYKSKERLAWEQEHDCITKMRDWMIASGIASEEELAGIERSAKERVRAEQRRAWADYNRTLKKEVDEAIALLTVIPNETVQLLLGELKSFTEPSLREVYSTVRRAIRLLRGSESNEKSALLKWYEEKQRINRDRYNSHLFTDTVEAPRHAVVVSAEYGAGSRMVDGREVLNACFDANFARDPKLVAFGEDVGKIGDVNQGFAGLQAKYGELRIFDTGIRESAIIGQGMGLAMRGLRPIAEIQYLDYLVYGLTVLTDDLASLSYRTKAGQKAPLIIRTRGHRLEGIWHSGSPMSMILGSMRGIHVCVPRNMTQAAGMYNTLLRSDEPALVIECLNGYRLKERMPANVGEFTVPLGKAEIVKEGRDVTVISYGSTLRIVQEAAAELEKLGISIEILDPQTLQPFDEDHLCAQSLSKTNKLLVVDEDVPGGASAFILQQVLEVQNGYYHLDGQPRTLTAKAHRPPYGSDGDYFSKPSADDVVEAVYAIMHEANPRDYPPLFG